MQAATEVLTAIAASTEGITRQDPGAREKLLSLARQLTVALETPSETIQRMGWAEVCDRIRFLQAWNTDSVQPAAFAASRMAVDLKIFETLEKADGASVGTSELAKATGADASLIGTLPVFTVAILAYYSSLHATSTEHLGSSDHEASLRHEYHHRNQRG